MEERSEFIKWLRWQSCSHGTVTERWLADIIGVSQSTIHRIYSGERKPTLPELIAIVYAFGEEDHMYDIFEMAGYSNSVDQFSNYRKWSVLQHQEHPAVCNKGDILPHHYWQRKGRRGERM